MPADDHTYGYDPLHQLTDIDTSSYTYDAADNLSGFPSGATQTFDHANQLTTAGYGYDTRGNRSAGFDPTGAPATYAYDQADRLTDLQVTGPPATTRESTSTAGAQGNGIAYKPAVSSDGRWVAFPSAATNLVPGDTNGVRDIFIRDRTDGTITRVLGVGGAQTNGSSHELSISEDGRYIAFTSNASNLVTGDTNGQRDIFVHDRVANTTVRASVSTSGVQADGESPYVAISGDGRYVAFSSAATNLVAGDTNGLKDIFVRDVQTSATTRVSVGLSGAQANGESRSPVISRDGQYAAYSSFATNLVTGDTNGKADIFVIDTTTGATTRVSLTSSGAQSNNASDEPAISADGNVIAFGSNASNLVTGDTNAVVDVFAHDRSTATTTRISVSSGGGQGDAASGGRVTDNRRSPYISSDGRYVMFGSEATNLVSGDSNATTDVFLHDRVLATTSRVSVDSAGGEANGKNVDGALSSDGAHIVFASLATNLVADDTNGQQDIFVHDSATSVSAAYAYNGDGLRTSKAVVGTSTEFTWDYSSGLPLLLSDGTTSYIYGPSGRPLEQITGTTAIYFHQDQLGSTRVLTDSAGVTVGTFTYNDYGKLAASTGSATTPFGWAGEYHDTESGLIYLRARYYDPTTGQFLTRDPLEAETREPYGYAGNDPINTTDPTGLKPRKCPDGMVDKGPGAGCQMIGSTTPMVLNGPAEPTDSTPSAPNAASGSEPFCTEDSAVCRFFIGILGPPVPLPDSVGDAGLYGIGLFIPLKYSPIGWVFALLASCGQTNLNNTQHPYYMEYEGFATYPQVTRG